MFAASLTRDRPNGEENYFLIRHIYIVRVTVQTYHSQCPSNNVKMSPNKIAKEKSACCQCDSFRYHKWVIYSLIALSLCLHFSFVVQKIGSHFESKSLDKVTVRDVKLQNVEDVKIDENVQQKVPENQNVVTESRQKRSVKGSSPRDYSDAKVEFIHPKLREEMDVNEQQDPNNPWVWLTSYSRIPVRNLYNDQPRFKPTSGVNV